MKKLVLLFVAAAGFAQAGVYSVTAFGAKADCATDCTAAIQKAIDRAAADGGGTAFVPGGGVYRTYTLHLKSNVELKVDRGATLKGIRSSRRRTCGGGTVRYAGTPARCSTPSGRRTWR